MSLKEDLREFVQSARVPVLPVPTPELPRWDGQIGVTRVSTRALAALWSDAEDEGLDERARFVALVACDLAGNRIFADEDVHWLATSAVLAPVIERLYWAGRAHNGLTQESREAWKKNSAPTEGPGSRCSSAGPCPPDMDSTTSD